MPSPNQSGMSLIEVMVAFVILTILTAPLISCFVAGNALAAAARNDVAALSLAQQKLEEIKAKPYALVRPEQAEPDHLPLPLAESYNGIFSYKVAVVEDAMKNLKTVTVTIYYRDKNKDRQVSLTTGKLKR